MKKICVLSLIILLALTSCATQSFDYDIDLTQLSSTMVYAEVYNMTIFPDEYIGKTIKINGVYYSGYYDVTGLTYHYIFIEDAAACCQQGIEFIWEGNHSYPNDYPEEGTSIEIAGVFDSYDELGTTYYYVQTEKIVTK